MENKNRLSCYFCGKPRQENVDAPFVCKECPPPTKTDSVGVFYPNHVQVIKCAFCEESLGFDTENRQTGFKSLTDWAGTACSTCYALFK